MAKVYIETHWLDKFDIDAVAGEACLSVSHFSHIFKAYTGLTPHCYYINIKIEKIKDNLLNMDLSVDEAFSECGVDYHGYYAALFKKKTGFSPSEYRKMALK
jgi:AraC-type DNA-binding domain-containing proteins